jgi:DedD protein
MTDTVDTLKQRVVGAFVIISLAVIFLPMVFDEPRQQESNIIVPVPPRPAFQVKEIERPVKPEFQRLQVNLKTQKVVEEERSASASNQLKINTDINKAAEAVIKDLDVTTANANDSSEKVVDISMTDSSPKVSHLPVFKNVWMVQLGVFTKTENAYQLRDQVRKDGFDCHTKQIDLNGTTAVKVFSGPFVDKTEAEKMKLKLDKKHKLDTKVIFFDA